MTPRLRLIALLALLVLAAVLLASTIHRDSPNAKSPTPVAHPVLRNAFKRGMIRCPRGEAVTRNLGSVEHHRRTLTAHALGCHYFDFADINGDHRLDEVIWDGQAGRDVNAGVSIQSRDRAFDAIAPSVHIRTNNRSFPIVGDLDGDRRADLILLLTSQSQKQAAPVQRLVVCRGLARGSFDRPRAIQLRDSHKRLMSSYTGDRWTWIVPLVASTGKLEGVALVGYSAVAGDGRTEIRLLRADATEQLTEVGSQHIPNLDAHRVASTDLNADGHPDILAIPTTSPPVFYEIDGRSGRIAEKTSPFPADSSDTVNWPVVEDGELYVVTTSGQIRVVPASGFKSAMSSPHTPAQLKTEGQIANLRLGNLDGDDRTDLLALYSKLGPPGDPSVPGGSRPLPLQSSSIQLLRRTASGRFVPMSDVLSFRQNIVEALLRDFDGDGHGDILLTSQDGTPWVAWGNGRGAFH